jgi:hypothetical protein
MTENKRSFRCMESSKKFSYLNEFKKILILLKSLGNMNNCKFNTKLKLLVF